MKTALVALLAAVGSSARSRGAMQLEILALRHQLAVYQRTNRRPRLMPSDRLLWVWLARVWSRPVRKFGREFHPSIRSVH